MVSGEKKTKDIFMANFIVIYIHEFSTSGVLSQNDYLNLVQCETLEDLKLHLQSTDYGNFLASESSLQVKRIFISHLFSSLLFLTLAFKTTLF